MPAHTIDNLKQVLRYDPDTGYFFWKSRPSNRVQIGGDAGVLRKDGYIKIGYAGHHYPAHRLAWAFMTGRWPPSRASNLQVEHRDSNKSNNCWSNLALVSVSKNRSNLRDKVRKDNRSGYRGVSRRPDGRWHARITANKKIILLGNYLDLGEAIEARKAAERHYFGPDRQP